MQPWRRRHQKPRLKHRGSFRLHRFCFITLNLSNVREFFTSWVLKVCISVLKKEKESRCLAFTFSFKREIKEFHFEVVQWRQRNVEKIPNACAKLLFCLSKGPSTRIFVSVWKQIFFFSGSAYLPHSLMQWKRSTKRHLFNNALQSGDFWKRTRLFFYVWTDENGFEFVHSYISSITHAQ